MRVDSDATTIGGAPIDPKKAAGKGAAAGAAAGAGDDAAEAGPSKKRRLVHAMSMSASEVRHFLHLSCSL